MSCRDRYSGHIRLLGGHLHVILGNRSISHPIPSSPLTPGLLLPRWHHKEVRYGSHPQPIPERARDLWVRRSIRNDADGCAVCIHGRRGRRYDAPALCGTIGEQSNGQGGNLFESLNSEFLGLGLYLVPHGLISHTV